MTLVFVAWLLNICSFAKVTGSSYEIGYSGFSIPNGRWRCNGVTTDYKLYDDCTPASECVSWEETGEEVEANVDGKIRIVGVFTVMISVLTLLMYIYECCALKKVLPERHFQIMGCIYLVFPFMYWIMYVLHSSQICDNLDANVDSKCKLGPGGIMGLINSLLCPLVALSCFKMHQNMDDRWKEDADGNADAGGEDNNAEDETQKKPEEEEQAPEQAKDQLAKTETPEEEDTSQEDDKANKEIEV